MCAPVQRCWWSRPARHSRPEELLPWGEYGCVPWQDHQFPSILLPTNLEPSIPLALLERLSPDAYALCSVRVASHPLVNHPFNRGAHSRAIVAQVLRRIYEPTILVARWSKYLNIFPERSVWRSSIITLAMVVGTPKSQFKGVRRRAYGFDGLNRRVLRRLLLSSGCSR